MNDLMKFMAWDNFAIYASQLPPEKCPKCGSDNTVKLPHTEPCYGHLNERHYNQCRVCHCQFWINREIIGE